jgi:hypothetical protein
VKDIPCLEKYICSMAWSTPPSSWWIATLNTKGRLGDL